MIFRNTLSDNFPPFIILSHMPYARHWFLCLNLQSNLPLNQQSKLIVRFSHITKHWLINFSFMFVWIHTIDYFLILILQKKIKMLALILKVLFSASLIFPGLITHLLFKVASMYENETPIYNSICITPDQSLLSVTERK